MEPDYYFVLQVDPGAEPDIITAAYHRLAVKYHPDVNRDRNASEKMRLLNEAFDVLSNSEKRAEYDRRRTRRLTVQKSSGHIREKYQSWWLIPLGAMIMLVILRFRPKLVLWGLIVFVVLWLLVRIRASDRRNK